MQRQQNQDMSWLAELRHHHHEHQTDHNEVQQPFLLGILQCGRHLPFAATTASQPCTRLPTCHPVCQTLCKLHACSVLARQKTQQPEALHPAMHTTKQNLHLTLLQAMCTVTGSQHSTGQVRQLAQTEVDWTNFRAALELYPAPHAQQQRQTGNVLGDILPGTAGDTDSYSLPDWSPCKAIASECSPRSGCRLSSPRSPRAQPRPYTAPTLVSRQVAHSNTDAPCYVSSLWKGAQQANLNLQCQMNAAADHSVHSIHAEGSSWSNPQPCSPTEPYLRSRSGGIALTYGSRERDQPHTSSGVIDAEPQISGSTSSRSKSGKLINAMRERSQPCSDARPQSHIVAKSKAWPASPDWHPTGSGLTVRQQAYCLGTCSLEKQQQQLAKKYGRWQQDLRSFTSCSASDAERLGMQADGCIAAANDAMTMTPQTYTTGPV